MVTFTFVVTPLPSAAVTLMVTLLPTPAFFVVTTPFSFTVAYFVLDDSYVTALFAAFSGAASGVIVTFLPAAIL